LNPKLVYLVYLNALEGKVGVNYLLNFHLKQMFDGEIKCSYEILFDEKNAENQFCSQLDGRINLKQQSKEKRHALASIVKDVTGLNKNLFRKALKNISKEVI
jgi:hypothetical protein